MGKIGRIEQGVLDLAKAIILNKKFNAPADIEDEIKITHTRFIKLCEDGLSWGENLKIALGEMKERVLKAEWG